MSGISESDFSSFRLLTLSTARTADSYDLSDEDLDSIDELLCPTNSYELSDEVLDSLNDPSRDIHDGICNSSWSLLRRHRAALLWL
jgi:hypothetical protein